MGSNLGLDGSGAIVSSYRITSLRENHKQGLGLGFSTFALELPSSSSPLSLLAAIGHRRALPSACSAQWIGFLRGRGLGQSLGRASALGFHPLIYLSTMHWGTPMENSGGLQSSPH